MPVVPSTIPVAAYLDPNSLDAELESIFATTWQMVGHVEKLRTPGDRVVTDVAGESIIVVCDERGELRAHHNVCSHRGAEVLTEDGCARRITCQYHAWTFNLDGSLAHVPNERVLGPVDRESHSLRSCRVEEAHGMVFVNLDPEAAPLSESAPWLEPTIREYAPNLPHHTLVHRTETTVKANWKIGIENFSECYHCTVIHKTFVTGVADPNSYRVIDKGGWHRHEASPRTDGDTAYAFDTSATDRANEFRVWWMWPNFAMQSYPGGVLHFWSWRPIAVDATHVTVDWYFPSTDLEPWQQDLIDSHAATTFAEDPPVIESIQRSMSSRAYRPGPILVDPDGGPASEHGVASIHALWNAAMSNAAKRDAEECNEAPEH